MLRMIEIGQKSSEFAIYTCTTEGCSSGCGKSGTTRLRAQEHERQTKHEVRVVYTDDELDPTDIPSQTEEQ